MIDYGETSKPETNQRGSVSKLKRFVMRPTVRFLINAIMFVFYIHVLIFTMAGAIEYIDNKYIEFVLFSCASTWVVLASVNLHLQLARWLDA